MKELTKAYKCDYCSKVSLSKSAIKNHERACKHNPANRTYCYTCGHSTTMKKDYVVYEGHAMEREMTVKEAPFCNYHDLYLIAPKLARASWFKLSADEMLMPVSSDKVCPFYKEMTYDQIAERFE